MKTRNTTQTIEACLRVNARLGDSVSVNTAVDPPTVYPWNRYAQKGEVVGVAQGQGARAGQMVTVRLVERRYV